MHGCPFSAWCRPSSPAAMPIRSFQMTPGHSRPTRALVTTRTLTRLRPHVMPTMMATRPTWIVVTTTHPSIPTPSRPATGSTMTAMGSSMTLTTHFPRGSTPLRMRMETAMAWPVGSHRMRRAGGDSSGRGDCNDAVDTVHPDAEEVCGSGFGITATVRLTSLCGFAWKRDCHHEHRRTA